MTGFADNESCPIFGPLFGRLLARREKAFHSACLPLYFRQENIRIGRAFAFGSGFYRIRDFTSWKNL